MISVTYSKVSGVPWSIYPVVSWTHAQGPWWGWEPARGFPFSALALRGQVDAWRAPTSTLDTFVWVSESCQNGRKILSQRRLFKELSWGITRFSSWKLKRGGFSIETLSDCLGKSSGATGLLKEGKHPLWSFNELVGVLQPKYIGVIYRLIAEWNRAALRVQDVGFGYSGFQKTWPWHGRWKISHLFSYL